MRRILVVDDDLHTRLAIRTWLQRCGFRVAIADGGVNGLAALDDSALDLMIVDIFMPNMRGFESIRVFHQRAPMVPLTAISGYAFSSGPQPVPPSRPHCPNSRVQRHHEFFEGELLRAELRDKTNIIASGGLT